MVGFGHCSAEKSTPSGLGDSIHHLFQLPAVFSGPHTPLKINMEPKNHPIEKENHLNQTSMFEFHVNIPGLCK